jgi:hypothetical protein
MGTSSETRRFSAALERAFSQPLSDQKNFNQYSHRFAAEYETVFRVLTSVKTADALAELMDSYLSLYEKYAANTDNIHFHRSDEAFVALLEQGKKVTSPTRNLLDDWIAELTGSGPSRLKNRYTDLSTHYRADVKKLIDDRRQSKSILTLLRDEYTRQRHVAAPTDDQLRAFDPADSPALKRDFDKVLSNTRDAWNACVAKNEDAPRAAFHAILDTYHGYLAGIAKQDVLKLFQLIKYFQDRLTTTRAQQGPMVVRSDPARDVLWCEMYTMACLQLCVVAQGTLRLPANRLRLTPDEQAYLLKPLHGYQYESNIAHRLGAELKSVALAFDATKNFLDLILLTRNQISRTELVDLRKTIEVQETWTQIQVATEKLKSAHWNVAALATLFTDEKTRRQLENLQRYLALELPVDVHDVGRRILRVGNSPGSHATLGTITIIQINPNNRRQVYIEFEGLRPNLFLVDATYLVDKTYGTAILDVHRSTIGMVYVVEGLMTALGFLPAFIEGGFVGVIYEVLVYFGSNKLGEWAAEVSPLFGQLVALAAGMAIPRPNLKPGLKGEFEDAIPRRAARVENEPFTQNRGIEEPLGSPEIEARMTGEDARGSVVGKPGEGVTTARPRLEPEPQRALDPEPATTKPAAARAEPMPSGSPKPTARPKVRQEPPTKGTAVNENRPIQTLDEVISEVASLQEAEGQTLAAGQEVGAEGQQIAADQGRVAMVGRGGGGPVSTTRGRMVSRSAGSGRGTGSTARGTANTEVPSKITLAPEVRLKLGNRFSRFVERSAEIYRDRMASLKARIKNPALRSTLAHNDTLKQMIKEFPETVRGKQHTGIMDTDPAGKGTVRESDVAYHDPASNVDKNFSGPVVELKSWAYVGEQGDIHTAGARAYVDAASPQMQSYEIMVDEQGIPVFVIDERGRIFGRDPDKGVWFQADK